jgi:hypothetical protein
MSEQKQIEELQKLLDKRVPLHPELVAHLESGGVPMIRHPLIYSIFHSDFQNAQVNTHFEWKKKEVAKARREKNWNNYIFLHERPYRLNAFLDIEKKLTGNEYWKMLGEIWTDSENIYQNLFLWKKLLGANRKGRCYFMDEDDREKFRALPNEIVVYRGCEPRNRDGLSYTTDRAKAEWFSRRLNKRGDDIVIEKLIKKADAFAFLGGRGENEIVLKPKWRLE